jgi:hypothetical protein
MKIGDYVDNIPYGIQGIIIDELNPIVDEDGNVVERRLMVMYNDGLDLRLSGDTFLRKIEVNDETR